jgi:hypothetical protein
MAPMLFILDDFTFISVPFISSSFNSQPCILYLTPLHTWLKQPIHKNLSSRLT